MDITIMVTIITIINHHEVITESCPRSLRFGHEKAMLSHNGSMAFFISVREAILFSRCLLSLMSTLSVVNMLQVIPLAIEAKDIRLA